jgi:hypothetical protein
MKRAIGLVVLLTSPCVGQENPYNPYVGLRDVGGLNFRPYVSIDRLNIAHQNLATGIRPVYFGSSGAGVRSTARQPGFGYYPNYPSFGVAPVRSRGPMASAAALERALPIALPLVGPGACDPYLDDDGCLGEIAGW